MVVPQCAHNGVTAGSHLYLDESLSWNTDGGGSSC